MNYKLYYLLCIVLSFTLSSLSAQDPGDQLFDNSYVHEVRLDFTQQDYWETLLNNFETNFDPFEAVPYLVGKVTIDGVEVDSVGVRFKGFTSYPFGSDKKPIKIDFNEFVPGQRFDGLRKLNLNNGTADPAMQRDVICYDLLRRMDVNAPRTAYTRVYFNGEYWGLYQLIEQVDKTFVDLNFSNDNGNLFKNLSWSKLEWLGPNPSSYQQIFSLKTNEEVNDWSGFIDFVDLLNNSSDSEFQDQIEDRFNVDLFLRNLAVDVATNNWDSYLEHGRNWYMYEDTSTGMFHWIPWDYNLALGGQLGGGGGTDDCIVFPDFYPLLEGSTTVSFFDRSFVNGTPTYSWDFGDGNTSTEENPIHTFAEAGTYEVCLAVIKDEECFDTTCKTISTTTDLNACDVIVDGSAGHSVGQAFAGVVNFDPSCCDIWSEDCEEIYGFFSGSGNSFSFGIDQRENGGVLIRRLLEVPAFYDRYQSFFCELIDEHYTLDNYVPFIEQNADLIATDIEEDPNFFYTYADFQQDSGEEGLQQLLADRIAELQQDLTDNITCDFAITDVNPNEVVINEFVASNDSTSMISDPAGEYPDWIELYNNTDESIDLSGIQLSDDGTEPDKWAFPIGTTIDPDGYLIIWADEDEDQPGLHASFKLSKGGEEIYLTNPDGTVIDFVEYGEQTTNIASARIPNGTGGFVFQDATFNANNEDPTSTTTLPSGGQVVLYPSPAQDQLWLQIESEIEEEYAVAIFALTGQQVAPEMQVNSSLFQIDVSTYPAGFYVLKLRTANGQERSLKWVKG